ncbi:MAG: abortive infection protein, partial [Nitrososphaerales archaeon]
MNRKGVCYDAGRVMMGEPWRPKFDETLARRELKIIKEDLHCNAVRICGLDIDRLVVASQAALDAGLEVWFCPEMWDRTQEDTLAYLREAAEAAEELRATHPGKVALSVGSELTLFMQGIVEGKNVFDRMNTPSFLENIRAGKHNAPLNAFLKQASEASRGVFHGPLTYFSLPFEAVDWKPFDFFGVDHYRDARIRDQYGKMVAAFRASGKPVLIGEFGCCTYRGAEMLGGNGFMIAFGMMADYLGPRLTLPKNTEETMRVAERVDGHYVRDEGLQAREIVDQLRVLDAAGVEGAFVHTFVSPTSTHVDDPRFDGDMGSYSLVK